MLALVIWGVFHSIAVILFGIECMNKLIWLHAWSGGEEAFLLLITGTVIVSQHLFWRKLRKKEKTPKWLTYVHTGLELLIGCAIIGLMLYFGFRDQSFSAVYISMIGMQLAILGSRIWANIAARKYDA